MLKKTNKRPAVFLDRDGVIIEEKHYISQPEDVELTPGAGEAIRLLSDAGYYTVVVSNQSGIARGYFTQKDYIKVTDMMVELLKNEEAFLDMILYSPYHPEGVIPEFSKKTECRKPGSGMFLEAEAKLGIDLSRSYMIGDRTSDIEAGKRLGLYTILVKTGYGKSSIEPDSTCENLFAAAVFISGGKK